MGKRKLSSLYAYLDAGKKADLARLMSMMTTPTSDNSSASATRAGKGMAFRMIDILEAWLLDEEQRRELVDNPWDIFFLYAAAHVFIEDGGHGVSEGTGGEAGEEDTVDSQDLDKKSTLRSAAPLADSRQLEIIHLISEGHSAPSTIREKIPPAVPYRNGVTVHTQLIAACLRLAAAFVLEAPAVRQRILLGLLASAGLTAKRIERSYNVTDVGPHPHFQASIRVRINCNDAEVHRALKRYERIVQRLLSDLNRLVRPRFIYTAVHFEISPHGYQPIDLKFSVDTASALQLFMGNTLYSDRRVFLRELVQNAVDACNMRQFLEPDFRPDIHIYFSPDISEIKICDNGIGMSKQWIEKYFLNIGLSFYQSDEIHRLNRDTDIQFSFISRFGIGFLSCFLVADKVVVKTRKEGQKGLVVTISNVDDYFDVRILQEEMPTGTEVAVVLKANSGRYSRSLEYLGYLKTNVRFLPMTVTVTDENGRQMNLGREPMDYDEEIRWGTKFTAKLNYHSSRGYLLLRVLETSEYIYDLESSQGGISIFQDGIFITQVDYLLPENARGYIVGRLNLIGGEKCELSMDRNRVYWAENQMAQTKSRVLIGLVTIANNLMETVAQQSTPENVQQNLTRKLAAFFGINDVDDLAFNRLNHQLRSSVVERFKTFVRANRYLFNISRRKQSQAENSHGYNYTWQKRLIDDFRGSERRQGSS